MVAFSIISALAVLSSLLLASPSQASPLPPSILKSLPSIDLKSWFCHLVHATLASELCLQEGSTGESVTTSIGIAQGVLDVSGVNRFVVKYASADRWSPSSVATAWELPYVNQLRLVCFRSHIYINSNGSTNVSALPLMCPQPYADTSTFTEDCLSMILYVPATLDIDSGVPTLMWYVSYSFFAAAIFI